MEVCWKQSLRPEFEFGWLGDRDIYHPYHAMVVPLMAAALIAHATSRLVCEEGVYHALASTGPAGQPRPPPRTRARNPRDSLAAIIGKAIAPLLAPVGFNWQIAVALIPGMRRAVI